LASSGGESSERPSGGEEDVEKAFYTYHHSRSQTSLSSFGVSGNETKIKMCDERIRDTR